MKSNRKLTKPEAFVYLQSINEFRDAIEIKFIHIIFGLLVMAVIFVGSFVWHFGN